MMEEIFREFVGVDGNYLEQFQTTAFDARSFELYLFALFNREGFALDRSYPNPDFVVERGGLKIAVEATTVNPSTSGPMSRIGTKIDDLSLEERLAYERDELAIRFGSAIFSKLQKRYWELAHCKDMPFVIAIQAFHDQGALEFSDSALERFLYGLDQTTGQWDSDGNLTVNTTRVESHQAADKTIPSNFFGQPDTEHVSAVVFSNSGSLAKFDRMGFQHGYGNTCYNLTRFGTAINADPDAMDATAFLYDVGHPPFVESWSQGLVVCHNPNATRPLPVEFFGPVINAFSEHGRLCHTRAPWHPIVSKTHATHLGEIFKDIPRQAFTRPAIAVAAISRETFVGLVGFSYESNPAFEENGWFTDMSTSFAGVILHDKTDDDWAWVIMARDPHFRFRAIKADSSFTHRKEACEKMQAEMLGLLLDAKRIFVQD